MIALIHGRIVEKSAASVILDAGGVGYELTAPASVLGRMGDVGEMARLRTYLEVKDDALTLYGFLERAELEIFRLLISVSGVGPRIAVAILSGLSPERIMEAIAREDVVTFGSVKGIGKKLASKIIFELRSKVGELPSLQSVPSGDLNRGVWAEASEALRGLGYKEQEISDSLGWVGKELEGPEPDLGQIVRKALAYFQQP